MQSFIPTSDAWQCTPRGGAPPACGRESNCNCKMNPKASGVWGLFVVAPSEREHWDVAPGASPVRRWSQSPPRLRLWKALQRHQVFPNPAPVGHAAAATHGRGARATLRPPQRGVTPRHRGLAGSSPCANLRFEIFILQFAISFPHRPSPDAPGLALPNTMPRTLPPRLPEFGCCPRGKLLYSPPG